MGKEAQEGGDICIVLLIHIVQQKLTQHCKAIILQFKMYFKKQKKDKCINAKKKMHRVQKDLKGYSACPASAGMTLHSQALIFYSNMSAVIDQLL